MGAKGGDGGADGVDEGATDGGSAPEGGIGGGFFIGLDAFDGNQNFAFEGALADKERFGFVEEVVDTVTVDAEDFGGFFGFNPCVEVGRNNTRFEDIITVSHRDHVGKDGETELVFVLVFFQLINCFIFSKESSLDSLKPVVFPAI